MWHWKQSLGLVSGKEEMSQEKSDHECEEVKLSNTVKAQVRLRCSFGSVHQWKN